MQKVLVFQRDKMGEAKVEAVRQYRPDINIELIDIDCPASPIIDEPEKFFPDNMDELLKGAELAIDHLYQADLTGCLVDKCNEAGVPVIASGRKLPWGAHTPLTCCTLGRIQALGEYAQTFGAPEFSVEVEDGKIASIRVIRGAPCGATWKAAPSVVGLEVEEAVVKIGLLAQFNCYAKANPNVFLKNPLHAAGEVHSVALKKAVARSSH